MISALLSLPVASQESFQPGAHAHKDTLTQCPPSSIEDVGWRTRQMNSSPCKPTRQWQPAGRGGKHSQDPPVLDSSTSLEPASGNLCPSPIKLLLWTWVNKDNSRFWNLELLFLTEFCYKNFKQCNSKHYIEKANPSTSSAAAESFCLPFSEGKHFCRTSSSFSTTPREWDGYFQWQHQLLSLFLTPCSMSWTSHVKIKNNILQQGIRLLWFLLIGRIKRADWHHAIN